MKSYTLSENALDTLANELPKEGIVLLRGDLSSGKTTLAKFLAKNLGIKNEITSPTFSLMQGYEDRFFHYDIYQEKTAGFLRQGLHENLSNKGLHVVEWGDEEFESMLKKLGYEYITVDIVPNDKNERIYKVAKCTD